MSLAVLRIFINKNKYLYITISLNLKFSIKNLNRLKKLEFFYR